MEELHVLVRIRIYTTNTIAVTKGWQCNLVLRFTFPQSHFGYTLTSVHKREPFSQRNIGSFYCSTIRRSDCFVA